MIGIAKHIKNASKVIGYFSYTDKGNVFCDDDACVIASSSEAMTDYLSTMASDGSEKNLVRKTRFGEIVEGLRQGAAYTFDSGSYERFYLQAKINDIDGLPTWGPYLAVIKSGLLRRQLVYHQNI